MLKRNNFSSRLRQAMDAKQIKQSELCEATGIGKSAMSQYLHGAFLPKQQNLFLLAAALDVSEAWLMGYEVKPERIKPGAVGFGSAADFDEDSGFILVVPDSSMVGAHILPGAEVAVNRSKKPASGQIAAFRSDKEIGLRRYIVRDGFVFLLAECGFGCGVCGGDRMVNRADDADAGDSEAVSGKTADAGADAPADCDSTVKAAVCGSGSAGDDAAAAYGDAAGSGAGGASAVPDFDLQAYGDNSAFPPMIFRQDELESDSCKVKILGVAAEVRFEL